MHIISILNFLLYIIVTAVFIAIGVISLKKYRLWRYRPLFKMSIGIFLLGLSGIIDICFRFQNIVDVGFSYFMILLGYVLFTVGTFVMISAIFSAQILIPWDRILFYAFANGMMVYFVYTPDYFITFNVEMSQWYFGTNSIIFYILSILLLLPVLEILTLVIRRQLRSGADKQHNKALNFFWIGLLFLLLSILVTLFFSSPTIIDFVETLFIAFGFMLIGYAFILDPLVFVLSNANLDDIIILRADQGDVPIASYSFSQKDFKGNLVATMISSVGKVLDTLVENNKEERKLIDLIQMGSKKVIIERSEHFVGMLFGKKMDKVCLIGLKLILTIFEKQYGHLTDVDASEMIKNEDFCLYIKKIFTFLSSEKVANIG